MAEQSSAKDGIETLWPTIFLRRTLRGYELANRELAAYILDLDQKNMDMTTDYLGGNLLVHDHPAIA